MGCPCGDPSSDPGTKTVGGGGRKKASPSQKVEDL